VMTFGEVEENKQASLSWALRLASVVCLHYLTVDRIDQNLL
jgi:hypothetical protein